MATDHRPALATGANPGAYVITGPTSGIGHAAAFELSRRGAVILVGRDPRKLADLKAALDKLGRTATVVVCDFGDLQSVWRAAAEIIALRQPILGLLNNAGILDPHATKTAAGLDTTFCVNHLGPFALTEALAPHLPDGAAVTFVVSSVEDEQANPGKRVGYRGGRYVSAIASARGEWRPGGSKLPGADAYATSKQCNLAAAMALARETPRLRFSAVSPGLILTTGLFGSQGGASAVTAALTTALTPLLQIFMPVLRTPAQAGRNLTRILTSGAGPSGAYYDERGRRARGSPLVEDPAFQDRVVAETRALLATLRR